MKNNGRPRARDGCGPRSTDANTPSRVRRAPEPAKVSARSFTGGDGSRTVLIALLVPIAILATYTVLRAFELRVDYFDGYQYLNNTRRLLGDSTASFQSIRPPAIPIVHMISLAIANEAEPASVWGLIVPHLLSAALSLLGSYAVFLVLRRPLGLRLALVGVALFMANRLFTRYSALALTDIPAAGLCALTFVAWAHARDQSKFRYYVVVGIIVGLAMATKYSLLFLLPAVLLSEVPSILAAREIPDRRLLGLTLGGAIGAIVFVAIHFLTHGLAETENYRIIHLLQHLDAATQVVRGTEEESLADYGAMSWVALSPAAVLFAASGIALAALQRQSRDAPFAAWLLVIGLGVAAKTGHTEARSLLPAYPAIIYFALRAVQFLLDAAGSRVQQGVIIALLATSTFTWIDQVRLDRDHALVGDVQRRATQWMLERRGSEGRLLWHGGLTTQITQEAVLFPEDEYFNTFHGDTFVSEYFARETVQRIEGDIEQYMAVSARSGDVILQAPPRSYTTRELRDGPRPDVAVHLFAVERIVSGEQGIDHNRRVVTTDRDHGLVELFAVIGNQARRLGETDLRPGHPFHFLRHLPSRAEVVILKIERETLG